MINHTKFKTKEQQKASMLIDYYNGKQLHYVIKMLNGEAENEEGKRDDWQEKNINPRMRNITKAIVDKSGMLFNQPPKLSVYSEYADEPQQEDTLMSLLEGAEWLEFFQNVDSYTRLTKASVVLAQRHIPNEVETHNGQYKFNAANGEGLLLTLLHPGNCVVEKDVLGNVIELAYLIDVPDEILQSEKNNQARDNLWAYRRITPQLIEDYLVQPHMGGKAKEELIFIEENIEGIVPAVVIYDTMKPYEGVFPQLPEDLCSLQNMYNLHLTDLEYSIAWQKQKTLFVNRNIESADGMPVNRGFMGDTEHNYQTLEEYGSENYSPQNHPLYPHEPAPATNIGGLGAVVKLEDDGEGGSPMVKFDGPDTDLKPLNDIIDSLVTNVASDWSVNIKMDGKGSATSGFQLVVEEIDNLNLRKKRSQYMTSGLRQLYHILQVLYPELTRGELEVEWANPSLPVNQKEQLDIWEKKINSGLASRVDYFMKEEGMSEDDAIKKVAKIDAYQNPTLNNEIDQTNRVINDAR